MEDLAAQSSVPTGRKPLPLSISPEQYRDGEDTLAFWIVAQEKKVNDCFYVGGAALVLGSILIVIGVYLLSSGTGRELIQHVAELIIPGLGLLGAAWILAAKKRALEDQAQDLEFEADLLKFKATDQEQRAEKLLQINRLQLRRYYNLNLGQNSRIFAVGVLCIVLGAAVIVYTLHLLSFVGAPPPGAADRPSTDKLVLGIVGTAGSLLANYVAAIFLKMHAAVAASLTNFHTKLVHTNDLFLANLLASRISDDAKRQDAFEKLSLAIVEHDGPRSPAREKPPGLSLPAAEKGRRSVDS